MHQYRSVPHLCHCLNQTSTTSGSNPVAFFKMPLRRHHRWKSNKNQDNYYWLPHIYHVWKLEQTTKNKLWKNCVEKIVRLLFQRGVRFVKVFVKLALHPSPHWQNGCHFADDISKCIYLNEKFYILIKLSSKFVSKDPIDNEPALV